MSSVTTNNSISHCGHRGLGLKKWFRKAPTSLESGDKIKLIFNQLCYHSNSLAAWTVFCCQSKPRRALSCKNWSKTKYRRVWRSSYHYIQDADRYSLHHVLRASRDIWEGLLNILWQSWVLFWDCLVFSNHYWCTDLSLSVFKVQKRVAQENDGSKKSFEFYTLYWNITLTHKKAGQLGSIQSAGSVSVTSFLQRKFL